MPRRVFVLALAGVAIAAGAFVAATRAHQPALQAPIRGVVSIREPEGMSYELYIPPGLDRTHLHPLVFGSSPGGLGAELVPVWRDTCDRLGWILIGSNNFRNGPYVAHDDELQRATLARALRDYPVDPARVYATGVSGGGMRAHGLIAELPAMFRGIVVNTGMMPFRWPGNAAFDPAHYPRAKQVVFLASPTDFRYAEMQGDRALLAQLGWTIEWLEFDGGHRYAPPALYVRAAEWLAAH